MNYALCAENAQVRLGIYGLLYSIIIDEIQLFFFSNYIAIQKLLYKNIENILLGNYKT